MEADVVRRDKIAAAKKKVWSTLLLLCKMKKAIRPLVYFVAVKLMLVGDVQRIALDLGVPETNPYTFSK